MSWYLFNKDSHEYLGQYKTLSQAEAGLGKKEWSQAINHYGAHPVKYIGDNSFVVDYDSPEDDPPVAFINELDVSLLSEYVDKASKFYDLDELTKRMQEVGELQKQFPYVAPPKRVRKKRATQK